MNTHRRLLWALGLAAVLLAGALVGTGVSAAVSANEDTASRRIAGSVPDPSTIVNLIGHRVAIKRCWPETTYTVPSGKALLLTDLLSRSATQEVLIWSDVRGEILRVHTQASVALRTPLVVEAGETVCAVQSAGPANVDALVLISGQLMDVP